MAMYGSSQTEDNDRMNDLLPPPSRLRVAEVLKTPNRFGFTGGPYQNNSNNNNKNRQNDNNIDSHSFD